MVIPEDTKRIRHYCKQKLISASKGECRSYPICTIMTSPQNKPITMQTIMPVPSAGKQANSATRGKTSKQCHARENSKQCQARENMLPAPSAGKQKTVPCVGKYATAAKRRETVASPDNYKWWNQTSFSPSSISSSLSFTI